MSLLKNERRAILVAVAGPSCSGKTSVSWIISTRLGATLLHLDKHWVANAERPLVNGYPSREQPHQYDGLGLMKEADTLLDGSHDVLAEGFLLLTYPEIRARADYTFFISVPHEVLAERRRARSLAGGNVVWTNRQGVTESRVDTGWQVHGQQEWETWGASQAQIPGVIILDGTRTTEDLALDILTHIKIPV